MEQLKLFDIEDIEKPVNVATVPLRSPFRYPGGKTWFVPYARKWLRQFNKDVTLIEPFAGGGIISLTAVMENLVKKAVMAEKDEDIASVWKTILSRNGKWLARQILDFDLSRENVSKVLSVPCSSTRQKGLITLLRNRLHHGGILASGSGLLKNGENGKGIASRWYPKTLFNRISAIADVRDRIEFLEADGFEVIKVNSNRNDAVFFIDPPYTKAAKRLYKYHNIDHNELFCAMSKVKGNFLMTYDDSEDIAQLAEKYKLTVKKVIMKTTLHYKKYELVIGRDLDWLYR